jgi:hypothetical protein
VEKKLESAAMVKFYKKGNLHVMKKKLKIIKFSKVLGPQQPSQPQQQAEISLRSSHSADTRHISNSPPPAYYPNSDGNLSTSSSTGSLKRRRSVRSSSNKNDITFDSKQDQWVKIEDGIDLTQKKLKGLNLHLYHNKSKKALYIKKLNVKFIFSVIINLGDPYRSLSYKIGDQVEAIKWTDDAKEWYCARVVEILNDTFKDESLIFVHYEGWPPEQADWISPTLIRNIHHNKPLQFGPAGAENESSWKDYAEFYISKSGEQARHHTGLVQDRRMSLHCCPCLSHETIHPERPDRISSILQTFHTNRYVK